MIVLNELRSGEIEALHVQTQRRWRGSNREEALSGLVEQMANALAAQRPGNLHWWAACGRLEEVGGRPRFTLRFGDRTVASSILRRLGRGSLQGGSIRFVGGDAAFGLEFAGAPNEVVNAAKRLADRMPGAEGDFREIVVQTKLMSTNDQPRT